VQRAAGRLFLHDRERPTRGSLSTATALVDPGINLLAFTAVPIGPLHMQLTIFPEGTGEARQRSAERSPRADGPHPALLVPGDDELGALAEFHRRLFDARVNVYASTGVADGSGCFGYITYVRPEDYDRAVVAMGP
jgi:hypothetical protein